MSWSGIMGASTFLLNFLIKVNIKLGFRDYEEKSINKNLLL